MLRKKYLYFVLSLGILLLAIPITASYLQQRTVIQQHASESPDDLTIDKFFNQDQELQQKGISSRFKVCRKNDTPKKCIHVVVSLFPSHPWHQKKPTYPKPVQDELTAISGTPADKTAQSGSNGPNATVLALAVCLHGLGNCGDNVASSGQGNLNPVHRERPVTVSVYNNSNQLITNKQTTVTYDQSSQNFKGAVELDSLRSGSYNIKVLVPGYLSNFVPGIQNITAKRTNTLPAVYLITGDINQNNALDIQDYNILMICISGITQESDCTQEQKIAADINDDGTVDFIDYNLLMREIISHKGT